MYKYAKSDPNIWPNIPCVSRVISIFTNCRTDAQQSLVLQKGCYACQSLVNVGMHEYAKCDQNITCGSRNTSIFANC